MKATFHKIHPDFKINDIAYNHATLIDFAIGLIKNGAAFEKEIGSFIQDWLSDEPSITVHTSGSTGIAKPIEIKKQYMFNSAMATGEYFHLKPGTSCLHCLPTQYIAGKMMWVRALTLGWEIDYVEPVSRPLKDNQIRYDFCAMVPLQLESSLDDLNGIDILIVGGAAVSRNLKEKIQSLQTEVFETYGMTETVTHVAVRLLNHKEHKGATSYGINMFRTLPNIMIDKDKRGCLVINAPMLNEEVVVTNDLVELLSETEFSWLGRIDHVINSGGIKLIPETLEKKLAPYIAADYFLAGEPHERLGEVLILLIEGEETDSVLLESIRSLSGLLEYERPQNIYYIQNFIRTATGKINRKATFSLIGN